MKKALLLFVICCPFLGNAQGFQVNLQGQKQQAMGGAGSAVAHDAASLFFNPGAASFQKHNSISIGTSPIIANTKFTDQASSTLSETNSPVTFPFSGYVVLGKKESKLKFGFATYTPFGSSVNWQNGWTGRFVLTELSLKTVYFQPTISYKISEQIGVGAGFVYGLGSLNLVSDLPMTDEDGNYTSLNLYGKGSGYGFNAGIYFQPTEKLSFGLNYRSQVQLKINKGNATFNVPAAMAENFPSGPFSTTLNMPKVITAGAAFKPSKNLLLAFDLSTVGWKCYDTLRYDFEKNTAYVSDAKLSRNYRNTYSYRLGGQYQINENLVSRLGIKYLSSPVKSGYVTPEVPDANHFSYSTGLGYRLNKSLTADVSFTFEHIKRTDCNSEIQLNGTYQTYLFIPGLSLSYNF
jgi:long-chain fatty acid transport protein